jgi:hypothetical protein
MITKTNEEVQYNLIISFTLTRFMKTQNISFSPFIIVVSLLLTFLCFGVPVLSSPILIHSLDTKNIGAIAFLSVLYCISIIMLPFFVMTLKCSLAFLQKQPAISLTEKYYIDNIESVQLEWHNISNISVLQYRDSFLKISVVDDSVVYRQAKNRIWKYIFKRQERNKGILSVNLNFIKGKSIDVVNLIKDYQQSVLRNGR